MSSLLSLAIWTPIVFGAVLLALGRDEHARAVRWIALIGALAGLLVTLPLYGGFQTGTAAMQFVEKAVWIERFNINYHLGVDGISFWFVPLTAFITVIVVLASWESITERVNQYMGAFLILSGLMIGVFTALDGMLFYVFFEATLIPMYLIIGIWGGPNKIYAAFKFFLYTLLGSLLMLIALIYLYNQSGGSFDIAAWHKMPLSSTAQTLLFFAFFAAFAVKVPMWPVHTWLPDVHVEAPTGGSAVLAAIMLKLGAYGFLRFSLPIAPDASREWAWLMIALSLVAVIYVGLVAMVQKEVAERMVAKPGGKDYGALSVAIQYYTEPAIAFMVPPASFVPPPSVDSAVIVCKRRQEPPVQIVDEKLFFRVVKASFSVRRKMLSNALKNMGIDSEQTAAWLTLAGIDGKRRGETLSLEEFAALTNTFEKISK